MIKRKECFGCLLAATLEICTSREKMVWAIVSTYPTAARSVTGVKHRTIPEVSCVVADKRQRNAENSRQERANQGRHGKLGEGEVGQSYRRHSNRDQPRNASEGIPETKAVQHLFDPRIRHSELAQVTGACAQPITEETIPEGDLSSGKETEKRPYR